MISPKALILLAPVLPQITSQIYPYPNYFIFCRSYCNILEIFNNPIVDFNHCFHHQYTLKSGTRRFGTFSLAMENIQHCGILFFHCRALLFHNIQLHFIYLCFYGSSIHSYVHGSRYKRMMYELWCPAKSTFWKCIYVWKFFMAHRMQKRP
jgi:hypothetical protein